MTWWTTASLGDGLVDEVLAVVCFMAGVAAAVVAVGLFVHGVGNALADRPVWLDAARLAGAVVSAVLCASTGLRIWPPGHPVGVGFVAVVVAVAAVPVTWAATAIVQLFIRLAHEDAWAMNGGVTAADQLDEFLASVEQRSPRRPSVPDATPMPGDGPGRYDG